MSDEIELSVEYDLEMFDVVLNYYFYLLIEHPVYFVEQHYYDVEKDIET